VHKQIMLSEGLGDAIGYRVPRGAEIESYIAVLSFYSSGLVAQGSTTLWESWTGTRHQVSGGSSRNHIVFGGGLAQGCFARDLLARFGYAARRAKPGDLGAFCAIKHTPLLVSP
jgi:hypothetical protein